MEGRENVQPTSRESPKELGRDGVVSDTVDLGDTLPNEVDDEHSCLVCCDPIPEAEVINSPGVYRMKRPPIVDDISTPLPRRVGGKRVKLSVSRRHS